MQTMKHISTSNKYIIVQDITTNNSVFEKHGKNKLNLLAFASPHQSPSILNCNCFVLALLSIELLSNSRKSGSIMLPCILSNMPPNLCLYCHPVWWQLSTVILITILGFSYYILNEVA